jgi:hypothetical protein
MNKLIALFFAIIGLIYFGFCITGHSFTGVAWGWFESDAEIAQAKAEQYKAETQLSQTEIERIRANAEAEVKLMQARSMYQPQIQHVAQSNVFDGVLGMFLLVLLFILLLFAIICIFLLKYNTNRTQYNMEYSDNIKRVIDKNGNEFEIRLIDKRRIV